MWRVAWMYFFTISFCVHAQQPQTVDDLLRALQIARNDTSRADIYNKLAGKYLETQISQTLSYADSAISLSSKLNYPAGLIEGIRIKGVGAAYVGNNDEARRQFLKVVAMAKENRLTGLVVRGLNSLSNVSNALSQFDSVVFYCNASLSIDSSDNNRKSIYSNMAIAFRQQGKYEECLNYHIKSLTLSRKQMDRLQERRTLNNIGNLYAMMKQWSDALRYFKESMDKLDTVTMYRDYGMLSMNMANTFAQMKNYSQAEKYYKVCLRVSKSMDLKTLVAQCWLNIGNTYSDRCRHKEARKYYKEAWTIADLIKDENMLAQINIANAHSFLATDQLERAASEAHAGLERCDRLGLIPLKVSAYSALHKIDSVKENYQKALEYFIKADAIEDSLSSKEKTRLIAEIENKYQAEKKAKEILSLKQEVEQNQVRLIKTQSQMYVAGALLLIVGGIVGLNRLRRKAIETRRRQEDAIGQYKEVLKAQEEVQDKVSRDLHDNIGQKMVALKMNLESIGVVVNPKVSGLLQEVTSDVRSLSHALSLHTLQSEGIKVAFEKLLELMLGNKIQYSYETFGLKHNYSYEVGINLYRIGQELISNIVKHAQAKNVSIQLLEDTTHLILIVEDDGVGFPKPLQMGFGMSSIEKRARVLRGTFYHESNDCKTILTIRIPL